MFTEKEISEIIKDKIELDENLGEQVGGSGHLGYKSFKIDHINKPKKIITATDKTWRITYTYTLSVETEFTYDPDNPPHEYKYKKAIILDKRRKIIDESPKEALWNDSQKVDDFLNE
ncbi:MAG: hypothetical protein ACFFAE_16495 [Candidatus Hodarchaeota archaeon]